VAVIEFGTVVTFFAEKGWGFIRPDNIASRDIFFHVSMLKPGQVIERGLRVAFRPGIAHNGRLCGFDVARA
jgi:cold shock CspA family protein